MTSRSEVRDLTTTRWAPPGHRERSCAEKRAYGHRSARRAARVLRSKGDAVHAYPCSWCHRWHVGADGDRS